MWISEKIGQKNKEKFNFSSKNRCENRSKRLFFIERKARCKLLPTCEEMRIDLYPSHFCLSSFPFQRGQKSHPLCVRSSWPWKRIFRSGYVCRAKSAGCRPQISAGIPSGPVALPPACCTINVWLPHPVFRWAQAKRPSLLQDASSALYWLTELGSWKGSLADWHYDCPIPFSARARTWQKTLFSVLNLQDRAMTHGKKTMMGLMGLLQHITGWLQHCCILLRSVVSSGQFFIPLVAQCIPIAQCFSNAPAASHKNSCVLWKRAPWWKVWHRCANNRQEKSTQWKKETNIHETKVSKQIHQDTKYMDNLHSTGTHHSCRQKSLKRAPFHWDTQHW